MKPLEGQETVDALFAFYLAVWRGQWAWMGVIHFCILFILIIGPRWDHARLKKRVRQLETAAFHRGERKTPWDEY